MTDTTQAPAGSHGHSRRPGGSGKARGGLSPAHRCGADAEVVGQDRKRRFCSRCEMDLRAGGQFRFALRTETGAEDVVSGHYIEVSPPHKLAFSWSSEKPQDFVDTRVTVDLLDLKDGTTRVVKRTRLASPAASSIYSAGCLRHVAGHELALRGGARERAQGLLGRTAVSSEQAGDRVRPRVPATPAR